MSGSFVDNMLNNSLNIILFDDVLGGFVGEGCSRTKDGIGDGLGKWLGHDYVSLTGFVMEKLSHRREQKVEKLYWGINMEEVRDNMMLFLDGGYEVQGNFTMNCF